MRAGIVFLHMTILNRQKTQHKNTSVIIPTREDPLDEKKESFSF